MNSASVIDAVRPAERRGITDAANLGVRLGLADDLVGDAMRAILLFELDHDSEHHLAGVREL